MSHFMRLFIPPLSFGVAVLQVIFLLCINERSSEYWILFIEEIGICESWVNKKHKVWNSEITYLVNSNFIIWIEKILKQKIVLIS